MAKELNMQFSGRIGPLIGCLRYGKYYYRGRPDKVRQTKATIASSSIFAQASKAGKIMRLHLQHSIPNPRDIHMQRQLAGRISNWLRQSKGQPAQPTADIPFVNHFNFNPAKPLQEALRIPLSFIQTGPGLTQLQMPAFIPAEAIKAPARITQIELCISAVAFCLDCDTGIGSENLTITVAYNNTPQPLQQIALPLPTNTGNILIVALQLRYMVEAGGQLNYVKADKFPAAIVGAVYL
jgi:hypothetical protein